MRAETWRTVQYIRGTRLSFQFVSIDPRSAQDGLDFGSTFELKPLKEKKTHTLCKLHAKAINKESM